jgi:hypothetical protein
MEEGLGLRGWGGDRTVAGADVQGEESWREVGDDVWGRAVRGRRGDCQVGSSCRHDKNTPSGLRVSGPGPDLGLG